MAWVCTALVVCAHEAVTEILECVGGYIHIVTHMETVFPYLAICVLTF